MKRSLIIFLIFMLVTVLYAEKAGSQIKKQAYNWKNGSTEFVGNNGRDSRSVPNLIDYQGRITDSDNIPITSSVSINFAIYDDATAVSNLWDETHSSVTPVDGLVHVLLGSETTFPTYLFDGSERWLGIKIGSDAEMTPRLRIVSVPYAIYANDSDNLDGYDSSYFLTTTYSIGDFVQGGIVFWVDETGQHGLMCAKLDQSANMRWYAGTDGYTRANGDGPLAGEMNTAIIIASQVAIGDDGNTYAARICAELQITEGGKTYSDWYLPSKEELNIMYQNKATIDATAIVNGGSGFASNYYWSSTEVEIYAWAQDFDIGSQNSNFNKFLSIHVRAVRAF